MTDKAGTARTLYQFPQSHFAEKGRWLLDYKGLDYQARNLYPVLNRLFLWPKTGVMTIPALNDGGRWVGDSTRIALYLDDAYPDLPPLLSADPVLRAQQLHLNRLAESLGVLVRQHAMIYLINTPVPPTLYFQDAPLTGPLRAVATWVFRAGVKSLYKTYPRYLPRVTAKMARLLDDAEQHVMARQHPDFLLGDQLSLADIALASMLAPLLLPEGSPWHSIAAPATPPDQDWVAVQQSVAQRPLGQFVYALYAGHRHSRHNWRGHW